VSLAFLLDTNVVSEPMRAVPDRGVMDRLEKHDDEIAIGAPVWHELRFGVERLPPSRRRARFEKFLREAVAASVPILPYDVEAAAWHAAERARLARAGTPAPFFDGQIAAIAAVNGLTLVTANARDFEVFTGIEVVDWRRPAR
jgi:tRNA(fMet)-specific endonuclease VapC